MLINSIRTKLTLWYVGALALVIIAFAVLTYFLVVRVLADETDENLEEIAQNFKTALEAEQADEPEKNSIEKDIREAVNESRFHDYSFVVCSKNNRLIASTVDDMNLDECLLKADALTNSYSTIKSGEETLRVHRIPLSLGAGAYQLFVLHSLEDQANFLARLRSIFFVAVPLAVLLTGLSGYFLARKSLAPVADMSRQAAIIGATNLNERLPVKNEKDELGNLARVINALLARLEDSFEQQRRFMADASHELRTPLAIVRGESEVALSKVNRPPNELRESLAVVHDESRRLTRIVEDLFTLARADAGQFKTDFTEIYLDELLADCVRAVRALAEKQEITLSVSTSEMTLRGDEQLLRRLFINLLDNAIKYNRTGGCILISGEKNARFCKVEIADTGIGICPEEQKKIFERFYRADAARRRSQETATSGAGLGLSIAQWIAGLHQAKVELVSSTRTGSTFNVIFPADKQL